MGDRIKNDYFIKRLRVASDEGNPSLLGLSKTNFAQKKTKMFVDMANDLGLDMMKKTMTNIDGTTINFRTGEIKKINILEEIKPMEIKPIDGKLPVDELSTKKPTKKYRRRIVVYTGDPIPEFVWIGEDNLNAVITMDGTLSGSRRSFSATEFQNIFGTAFVGTPLSQILTWIALDYSPANGLEPMNLVAETDAITLLTKIDNESVRSYYTQEGVFEGIAHGSRQTTTNNYKIKRSVSDIVLDEYEYIKIYTHTFDTAVWSDNSGGYCTGGYTTFNQTTHNNSGDVPSVSGSGVVGEDTYIYFSGIKNLNEQTYNRQDCINSYMYYGVMCLQTIYDITECTVACSERGGMTDSSNITIRNQYGGGTNVPTDGDFYSSFSNSIFSFPKESDKTHNVFPFSWFCGNNTYHERSWCVNNEYDYSETERIDVVHYGFFRLGQFETITFGVDKNTTHVLDGIKMGCYCSAAQHQKIRVYTWTEEVV